MAYALAFLCSPLDQPSGLGGGYLPVSSSGDVQRPPPGPETRTAVFVDGQNLFHAAREAFGPHRPTCDVAALARAVCRTRAWNLTEVAFYTGMPARQENPAWHRFWVRQLGILGTRGVRVVTRPLRYRVEHVRTAAGTASVRVAREKGIDVRIALDVVRCALEGRADVLLVFSQDQDLAEVAAEIRTVAALTARPLRIASAFPVGPGTRSARGIDGTDWIPIDRTTYWACLADPRRRERPR